MHAGTILFANVLCECYNLRCGVLDVPHTFVVYSMELSSHENLKAKQFTTKAAGEKL